MFLAVLIKISYRVKQGIKNRREYKTKQNRAILQTNDVKNLSIIMFDN